MTFARKNRFLYLRNFILIGLVIVFSSQLNILAPISSDFEEPGSIEFSSSVKPGSKCELIFSDLNESIKINYEDLCLFQEKVLRTDYSLEKIENKSSEEILALVEHLSITEGQPLLDFSIEKLSPRKQKSLLVAVRKITESRDVSKIKLDRVVAEIFRVYKEETLVARVRNLPKTVLEKVLKRWRQLESDKIASYLNIEFVQIGVFEFMKKNGFVSDPTRFEKFTQFFRDHENYIRLLLTFAVDIPLQYFGHIPALVPIFNNQQSILKTPADYENYRLKGPKAFSDRVQLTYGSDKKQWVERYSFIARAVSTIASMALLSSIPYGAYKARQQAPVTAGEVLTERLSELAEPLSARVEGERQFEDYLNFMRSKGVIIPDPLTPELLAQKQFMIEGFEKVIARREQQDSKSH